MSSAFSLQLIRLVPWSPKIYDKTDTLDVSDLRENNPERFIVHGTWNYRTFEQLLGKHRTNGWAGAGYHLFIAENSKLYQGRPFDREGAHAIGHNTSSISLCIYSPDGVLTPRRKILAIRTLDFLQGIYGDLPIISHTQAQAIYINNLLHNQESTLQLPTDASVTSIDGFNDLKAQLDGIVNQISTTTNYKLKQGIKNLKNCPGPLFLELT